MEPMDALVNSWERQAVLLNHGVLSDSTSFILSGNEQPSKSIVYQLADEGYDVWLINFRGSLLSRSHTWLDADSQKDFWDYSFEEMG